MSVLALYNASFWEKFFQSVPVGGDEFEMLADVAASAGVSYKFARERVNDYLAGRLVEQPQNPFAPSPYWPDNYTVH